MSKDECLMWVLIAFFVTIGVTMSILGICECISDCICGPKLDDQELDEQEGED